MWEKHFHYFFFLLIFFTARISKLRFSVPKNDKKKKKDINTEIETLERELKAKHEKELKDIRGQQFNDENTSCNNNDSLYSVDTQPLKTTKSKRRRDNKERKERERNERIKSGQIDDSENIRLIEMKRIESLLEERNLSLCEISSDGDCMYKAIEHQMRLTRNINYSVEELRALASNYIRRNKDDFVPFLLNEENNVVSDSEFDVYCDKIANTNTWGGHLELKALSNCLKVPMEIIQAEGTSIQIGFTEFGHNNPLILW